MEKEQKEINARSGLLALLLTLIATLMILVGLLIGSDNNANAFDVVTSPTDVQSWLMAKYGTWYLQITTSWSDSTQKQIVINNTVNGLKLNLNTRTDDWTYWSTTCSLSQPYTFIIQEHKGLYLSNIVCKNFVWWSVIMTDIIFPWNMSYKIVSHNVNWTEQITVDKKVLLDSNIMTFTWSNLIINQYSNTGIIWTNYVLPKPSAWFDIMKWTLPVFLRWSAGSYFYAYQWTDWKAYKVLDTFSSGADLPIATSSWLQSLPLWKIWYNSLMLALQWAWSGTIYVPDAVTSSGTFGMDTSVILRNLIDFQNPVWYMKTSSWSIVKWDMNCMTPSYDSCRLFSWVYKCANNAWTQSPNGEVCGWSVNVSDPTCSDGIQNQDEIGIDYGGICNNIRSTGCYSKTYNILIPNAYQYMFLTGWTDTVNSTTEKSFDNYSSDSMNEDYFGLMQSMTWSLLYTWSLQVTNWWPTSLIKPNDATDATQVEIYAMRSWEWRKINYVRFHTTYQWISILGAQIQNYVADVTFKNKNGSVTVPMTWTGWYATAQTSSYADASLTIKGFSSAMPFDWFEIGYSTGTTTKTNCGNQYYSCEFNQTWPTTLSCNSSLNPSGTPQWSCVVVNSTCQPSSNTWAYYDGFTSNGSNLVPITDGSGNTVWISYSWSEDIFNCKIWDGLQAIGDALTCPFTIVKNIWAKFSGVLKNITDFMSNTVNIGNNSYSGNILSFMIDTAEAKDSPLKWSWVQIMDWQKNADWTTYSDYSGAIASWSVNPLVWSFFHAQDNLRNQKDGIWWLVKVGTFSIYFLWFMTVFFLIVGAIAYKKD